MSNVLISIASEFDNRAFRKAEASTSLLEKQAKKLGKTLLGAFSVHQVMQYSKASVLAYTNDAKAAALLANQLKNLGLSYQAVNVEKFISDLQSATGILDDELRPAFAKLVRVTGSIAETQKLMTAAFDASRGAGIEYAQAIDIIAKAYVGNYRGIKQLNLGLSESEIKMMSFDELLNKITKHFKGAGAAAINSYAGKIDLLKVAAANAQETIGKGFVDAFTMIADDANFQNLIKDIDNAALAVADMIRGVGVALDWVDSHTPSWIKKLIEYGLKLYGPLQALKGLMGLGANARKYDPLTSAGGSYYSKQAADKQAAAAAKTAAKSAAARLAAEKKITLEKKAQAALDKANIALGAANNVFDIERIGVAAAMQNQTLTENEKKRLEIKQAIFALEDAIDSKDTARITKQTDILNGLLGQFATMQAQDKLLGQIKLAFDSLGINKDLINLKNLQDALDLLTKMSKITIGGITVGAGVGGGTSGVTTGGGTVVNTVYGVGNKNLLEGSGVYDFKSPYSYGMGNPNLFTNSGVYNNTPTVIVQITDNAQKLVDAVTFATQNNSANGTPIALTRNATNLAW